jgi:hypothetical protein
MSKHKHKKDRPKKDGHSGGGSAGGSSNASMLLAELDERVEQIRQADATTHIGPVWGEIHKLLLKVHADTGMAARVVASRDLVSLTQLIAAVRGGEPAVDENDDASGSDRRADANDSDIPPETLKKALRAFRKRLKLTRLDHESKLGRSVMTSGKQADVDAILAPYEFPAEVWKALAARGDLEDAGRGFFRLPNEQ